MTNRLDDIRKRHSWQHWCTPGCASGCNRSLDPGMVVDPDVELLVDIIHTVASLKEAESSDPGFVAGYGTALELVRTVINYKLNGLEEGRDG